MAGSVTGVATTFGLPNYHGELFKLTPTSTPLLSAIGGLTGGRQTSAVEFEWQTSDLRNPSQQRTRVEGAPAPTAEQRVRDKVRNVCQIHQEKVSISYTKQSTPGQFTSPSSAPYRGVSDGGNPVSNELDWQVEQALASIALDVNFSFINGTKANPTSNATARQTGGLLEQIVTNKTTKWTSVGTGLSAATDTITESATPVSNDDRIVFTDVGASTAIVAGRTYFVVSKASGSFKVSATKGGSAITIGTATVSYGLPDTNALATTTIDEICQMAYDNGGLSDPFTATLLVNSRQKRAISAAYASAYGKYVENTRNVGGVNVTTLITDFGELSVMLDRHVPQDAIIVASLEQLAPVFLNVPGKGVFFEEPLAKTGASDDVQLYGEIGLQFGNEMAHAQIRGLKLA